jgi:fructose-specific phosphotransferase system IIC component
MSEGGMESRIMLWRPVSSKDARSICVLMFAAFLATLFVGLVFTQIYGRELEGVFYGLGGFFLGVSEVMYWIYRGLQKR